MYDVTDIAARRERNTMSNGTFIPIQADAANGRMPAQLRRVRIREMLARREAVAIPDLSTLFQVSEMTIRRDLDQLEQDGELRRTHGGAIATERVSFELNFHMRRLAQSARKQAIAREAARLVQPGQHIMIDNGTTTLELALTIKDYENLTIITPSLAVASALQYSDRIETILLGGVLRRGQPDLTGGVTEYTLDLFSADLVFQGADGIDRDGCIYTADVQLARVDQRMRQHATRSIILADSLKFGKRELVRSGSLTSVSTLITDDAIDPALLTHYRNMGVEVLVAATTGEN
jgi:DeoR/GlpR family transcriptional regulator of sugar metabolism